MVKKPTMEEYKKIGMDFKLLHDRLTVLLVKVCNKCGDRKKYGDKLEVALKQFDKVRSELEDLMFKHYPNEATTNIFYGDRPKKYVIEDNEVVKEENKTND